MLSTMQPQPAPNHQFTSLPEPVERRDLGEFKTVTPDGTVEVVKKRLHVYEAPVPCNIEANRELAEQRRRHKDPYTVAATDDFFIGRRASHVDKNQVRHELEQQIAMKRQDAARQKELDTQAEQRCNEQARVEHEAATNAEVRRNSTRREEARRALEGSVRRQCDDTPKQRTRTSILVGDGGAAAARSREIDRATAEEQRQALADKQRRSEEERQARFQALRGEANRIRQETMAAYDERRNARIAAQQRTAEELRRSRDEYRKNKKALEAREKADDARLLAEQMKQHEDRSRRDAEHRQRLKAECAESSRRELMERQQQHGKKEPTQLHAREEIQVLLRCPKSGRLLPPSAFNIPLRR